MPPPNIQTSNRTLRSYILVRFQQSPSNLAVLLIYSGDDGLSLTCPSCFQKAEKQKKRELWKGLLTGFVLFRFFVILI